MAEHLSQQSRPVSSESSLLTVVMPVSFSSYMINASELMYQSEVHIPSQIQNLFLSDSVPNILVVR